MLNSEWGIFDSEMINSLPVPTPFIVEASSIASPFTAVHQSFAAPRSKTRAFQVADHPIAQAGVSGCIC